jgi:hypothetical protein
VSDCDSVGKIKLECSRNSWLAFSIHHAYLWAIMSDLSFRLTELRSLLIPFSQFAAWPIFFVLTSAISQQPAYFLALALVLAADLFDSSPRNRGLIRDSVAGAATAIIAVFLNDQYGLAIGGAVALVAVSRIVQKIKSRSIGS